MTDLTIEADPAEVGFDPTRLKRVDDYFARYVEHGRLPGWLLVVARHGRIAHVASSGLRDVEAGLPIEHDTLFRIYSMTKPITSVAAMMLYEEGAFELKDPIHRYLPEFRHMRVFTGGSAIAPVTVPASEPIRVWHLLTHTAGLTYGFHHAHPVDGIYRKAGFEWGAPADQDLAACCARWAELPLVFEPGSRWNYSVATDVLGRLVEVLSGQTLDAFFAERIFGPLGMTDTSFEVRDGDLDRLAALYVPRPGTREILRYDAMGASITKPPVFLSGGGGLVSTAHDYHRFAEMLRRDGELDGVRLLGPRTVRYMGTNHLPGGVDLEAYGQSTFAETTFDGVGFGLGFAVVQDPAATKVLSSAGEMSWGGAASTGFFVDPVEDITAVFLTQLLPSSTYALRSQLKQVLYQALLP
jgi:CubicO group peptidase (beta-lactamase class C family)